MAELVEERVGDGARRGRAGARVEERELTEHLARPEDGQEVLPAVVRASAELDLALCDHVQPVAGLALAEQYVPTGELDLLHRVEQRPGLFAVHGGEEGGGEHYVVVHAMSFGC
ncbi:hypothetical protein D3C74_440790 [compost metagenome]